ncbi:MAG: hypothetical protein ACYDAR_22335 [Thermomicrobiales bacterium]
MTVRRRTSRARTNTPKRRAPFRRNPSHRTGADIITVEMTRDQLRAINHLTSYAEQDLQDSAERRAAAKVARQFTTNNAGR